MNFIPILVLIPLMYLMLIRAPQRKVARARALSDSLQVGEKVITAGGMVGTIETMEEFTISLRVAPDTVLTFIRPAVTRRYEEPASASSPAPDSEE